MPSILPPVQAENIRQNAEDQPGMRPHLAKSYDSLFWAGMSYTGNFDRILVWVRL